MNRKQRRKKNLLKKQSEMNKIDPLSIPLPDIGSKKVEKKETKEDENTTEEKKANSDPTNIPLPLNNKTTKSDNVSVLAPPPPPPGDQQNVPKASNVMPNFMAPPPPPGMMGQGYMPYDPRMRLPPPHYPNMPPPHYNGPYPGPPSYGNPQEVSKSRSPPPLPPPRSPSPKPPPPPKKDDIKAMSMDIPADQAAHFQKLQKQAQKHAMRSLKRQMKQLKGEDPSDISSSESEEEEKAPSQQGEEVCEEDIQLVPVMSPSLSLGQQTYIIAQPGQASTAMGHQIVVGSDGRQFIIPGVSASSLAGLPIQAGAPVFAMPGAAQPQLVTLAPGAGATPAHLAGAVQSPFLSSGMPLGASSLLAHHPLLAAQSHLGAFQHQLVPGASSLGHGPIVIGNQILVPRFIRPAI